MPSASLKLRASWGTSFRAPKLVDVYDTSLNAAGLASIPDPRSPFGTAVILARQGSSNLDLNQETATTWTAGVDFAPTALPGLTLSLTYYSINYQDRILIPGPASPADILLQEDRWSEVIERNPLQSDVDAICESSEFRGSVAQCKATPVAAIVDFRMRNLASTRVRGLDAKLDRSVSTRYGDFSFGLNGAYLFSFEQATSDSSPMIDIVNTVGNPLALRFRGTFGWYQRGWDRPGFGIDAALDHSGGYTDVDGSLARKVDAFTTLDLRVSYRTARDQGSLGGIELGLNAANVFNQAPPFVDRDYGYDVVNTEPYGRVVSFGIQKKW
jgi:outer membrane receptor protein involved in Fe transport